MPLESELNKFNQPVGRSIPGWQTPPTPNIDKLAGRYTNLIPLEVAHSRPLFEAYGDEPGFWTYLPYGPFDDHLEYEAWILKVTKSPDIFLSILDERGLPVGVLALAAIQPAKGSIEIAHLAFSSYMKNTRIATEAIYLILKYVYSLGYRRCEWKCNALNKPSIIAAQRFGFSYEGIWRNALIVKGRNRDTAWFAMTDEDWLKIQPIYQECLSPHNFDEKAYQKSSLSHKTRQYLYQQWIDPNTL